MAYGAIEAPRGDLAASLALVDGALRPAPKTVIQSELARLRVMTKSRNENQADLTMTAAAYADALAEYPADVVADALRNWAACEKWWPAWAELKDRLDRGVRKRRALRAALVRGMR